MYCLFRHKPHPQPLALNKITSCPAPHPRRTGEDDSPTLSCNKHKLQAKLKNCKFGKPHVKYLGYIVDSGEVHVDKDKVAAVDNWEAPKDVKGI